MEQTKLNIPHADLIRAVLDGAQVQTRVSDTDVWQDATATWALSWMTNEVGRFQFRLKPDPLVRWVPLFRGFGSLSVSVGTRQMNWDAATKEAAVAGLCSHDQGVIRKHGKVLRLELHPDTLDVISATTETP